MEALRFLVLEWEWGKVKEYWWHRSLTEAKMKVAANRHKYSLYYELWDPSDKIDKLSSLTCVTVNNSEPKAVSDMTIYLDSK